MSTRDPGASAAPSDLELMAYFDGELDPERVELVERFLRENRPAQSKLRGLALGGQMLRMRSSMGASPADAIAASVMAAIDTPPPIEAPIAPVRLPAAPAANENRPRRFVWVASLAVAAAAAMFAWGQSDLLRGDTRAHTRSIPSTQALDPGRSALSTPSPVAAPAEPTGAAPTPFGAEEAADPIHGVEVAAVEFGAKMGSIFYVPTGEAPANSTTTVVWLADDAAGEE